MKIQTLIDNIKDNINNPEVIMLLVDAFEKQLKVDSISIDPERIERDAEKYIAHYFPGSLRDLQYTCKLAHKLGAMETILNTIISKYF